MRFFRLLVAASVTTLSVLLAGATSAAAHDVHTYGAVTLSLGWVTEPAYVGVPNAVQVIVRDASGKPITTITDKDLTVTITAAGGAPLSNQPLVPTADPDTGLGLAGEYEFHFIPTAPGAYTFHVTGTVAGQAIDDNVTSSDSTFDEVTDPTTVDYPAKIPSTSDISTKTDRVDARAQAAQQAADAAHSTAVIAVIVAVVAVVLAIGSGTAAMLTLRRRKA